MFLEHSTHNSTTWFETLQEIANLRFDYEQIKKNVFETNNYLQTCNPKLKTMEQTLKNHDKEIFTVKG
jgi:hypothetical protein